MGGIDYEPFISDRARLYKPAAIRGLFPLEERPGKRFEINCRVNSDRCRYDLAAGWQTVCPFVDRTSKLKCRNASTFPFESLQLNLKAVDGESTSLTIEGDDLVEALQYTATAGLPRLVKWLTELVRHVHLQGQQRDDWLVRLGSGSQDCMYKVFQAILGDGDSILLEAPTYAGTIGLIRGMENVSMVPIASDEDGIVPEELEETLKSWPSDRKFPKVVYTCPTGANPTGSSASEQRKIDILRVAKKHNILIIEDDAYYFVYYGHTKQARSYFSLENEANGETGRVIRLDSFSKIVSSGLRIGFTTAPKRICEIIDLLTANTNLQVASTTQAIALKLVTHWGIPKFISHCQRVAKFYEKQRDMADELAQKHLKGLVSYTVPTAGMFLWFRLLDVPEDLDSSKLLMTKGVEAGFLACPGAGFQCDPSFKLPPHIRVSFSLATRETLDEAFRRLAIVIKQAQSDAK